MTFKLHRKNHAGIRARPTIKPWQIGHLNKGRQTSKDPIVPEILKQKIWENVPFRAQKLIL